MEEKPPEKETFALPNEEEGAPPPLLSKDALTDENQKEARPALPAWKGQPNVPAWKGQPEICAGAPVMVVAPAKSALRHIPRPVVTRSHVPPTNAAAPKSLDSSLEEGVAFPNTVIKEKAGVDDTADAAHQGGSDRAEKYRDPSGASEHGGTRTEHPTNEGAERNPTAVQKQAPNVLRPGACSVVNSHPPRSTLSPILPRKPKKTDPLEIILSPTGWGDNEHPILTKLIKAHFDSYFKEGGTENVFSQTIDLVIHRLFSEYKPVVIAAEKHRQRFVLDTGVVMVKGHYRSRLVAKIRECFLHAKEQRLKVQRSLGDVAAAPPPPPPKRADSDPLMCDELIEPYLDPVILFHQQQQALRLREQEELHFIQQYQQRHDELRQKLHETTQQQQSLLGPQQPLLGRTQVVIQHGRPQQRAQVRVTVQAPFANAGSGPKMAPAGRKAPPTTMASVLELPRPKTPNRGIIHLHDIDETPVIANTKKARTESSVTTGTKLFSTTGGMVSSYKRQYRKKKRVVVKSAAKPVHCVPMPLVAVDELTYDWSSLKLDATAAWNRLLKQRMLENPGTYRTVPQVSAVDTYRLMQNLKDSLQTIMPPEDSPLHEALGASPVASARDMAEDLSQRRRVRLSSTVPPPTPANCPDDLRPLFPRLAIVYNEMVAQDLEPATSMQQRFYQYMTADEMRQHMIAAEQDVAALAAKEERVLRTAQQLGLLGKRRRIDEMSGDDENNESCKAAVKPVFWREDFATLLKKDGGSTTRYLMVHDKF